MKPPPVYMFGVRIEALPDTLPFTELPSSVCAFVGPSAEGPLGEARRVQSVADVEAAYGDAAASPLAEAAEDYFANGGAVAWLLRIDDGAALDLSPLDAAPDVDLLCAPSGASGERDAAAHAALADWARQHRALYLADPPATWSARAAAGRVQDILPSDLGIPTEAMGHVAVYFPPLVGRAAGETAPVRGPAAAVAGVIARTDRDHGPWKAPAGMQAGLSRLGGLACALSDEDNDVLNDNGINALRDFEGRGSAVWGARLLRAAHARTAEDKYLSVRRLALHIERVLAHNLRDLVFEPPRPDLGERVRERVATYLLGLHRAGAFAGSSPKEAFGVQCTDVPSAKALDVSVRFAPLRPAEFTIVQVRLPTA